VTDDEAQKLIDAARHRLYDDPRPEVTITRCPGAWTMRYRIDVCWGWCYGGWRFTEKRARKAADRMARRLVKDFTPNPVVAKYKAEP
jgi:hypothetical protein